MITPEMMVWVIIGYLFLEGFANILAGTFRVEKKQQYDEASVVLGVIIVIIAIVLLLM